MVDVVVDGGFESGLDYCEVWGVLVGVRGHEGMVAIALGYLRSLKVTERGDHGL